MPVNVDPPASVAEYFNRKQLKPSFDYRDVWLEEHAHAFTVAKTSGFDVLADIQDVLKSGLNEGKSRHQLALELEEAMVKKGWWGIKELTDPISGKKRDVQLGSPRRINTIVDANLRTARAAGQWERIQRRMETHPYLIYELGPSVNHRDEHVRWRGFIAHASDPFWRSHFPPNGWGCKCRVRQISKRQAATLVEDNNYIDYRTQSIPEQETIEWINKRTGEIERVPKGIDPGWNSNPGISRFGDAMDRLVDRIETTTYQNARHLIGQVMQSSVPDAFLKLRNVSLPVAVVPVAASESAQVVRMLPAMSGGLTRDQLAMVEPALELKARSLVDGEVNVVEFLGVEFRFYQDESGRWLVEIRP